MRDLMPSRLMLLVATLATAAMVAGLAVTASPVLAAAGLGPHPVPCGGGPCDQDGDAGAHVMPQSSVITLTISPHIAHVGQIIHMDLSYGGTGHCKVSQGSVCGPQNAGNVVRVDCGSGREDPDLPTDDAHQCFKALGATTGWNVITAPAGQCNPSDCVTADYLAIDNSAEQLSGTVEAGHQSTRVSGVRVTADGPGGRQSTTTDVHGNYLFAVKKGRYTVTAGRPTVPASRSVEVNSDTTGVDFKLASDQLALSFSPGAVEADGTGHFEGTATDTDTAGAPVSDQSLSFTPPLDVTPRALVCSPTGLVYPTLLSDGSPLGSHFDRTTDAGGIVPLAVWVGTQPGSWLLGAAESDDGSVTASATLPFGAGGSSAFTPGQIPQQLGNAVGSTIGGSGINLFKDFGAIGQSQASDQAVLLAFLRTVTGKFPGADYGPVHGAGSAGIVFYRHGTADPSSGVVMSIDQAADVVDAVGTGKPIPAADESLPTLGVWASEHSTTPTAALGSLNAPPQEGLEYFGFPYPPPVTSATAQVSFYGPCLAPDPSLQEVQTHSPVRLSFTGPDHYQFGLGANGKSQGNGSGLIERSGDVTTYAIPRGSYTMQVTATGKGPATIVMLSPAKRTQTVQSVSLTVRKGQSGNLALGPGGAAGPLRLGAKSVRASKGLPLTLKGVPRTLRAKHRTRLQLTLSSFGVPITGALVTASGRSRAAGVSNQRGTVRLSLTPTSKGKVSLTISVPGSGALRRQIRVRQ